MVTIKRMCKTLTMQPVMKLNLINFFQLLLNGLTQSRGLVLTLKHGQIVIFLKFFIKLLLLLLLLLCTSQSNEQ